MSQTNPFCFIYFSSRVSLLCPGPGLRPSYLHFLHSWDDRCAATPGSLLLETGSCSLFAWADLPISTSQVARITGVSHCAWLLELCLSRSEETMQDHGWHILDARGIFLHIIGLCSSSHICLEVLSVLIPPLWNAHFTWWPSYKNV
jgi:hypothetical protein